MNCPDCNKKECGCGFFYKYAIPAAFMALFIFVILFI